MPTPRSEFLAGLRAELPILVGVIPFGLIYGALALTAGLPAGAAQAMSAVVFAGSSQFIATQLVGVNTPGLIIVLTVAVVNLRHALYSASVAPYLGRCSRLWKWLLAYLLTDEAYAVTILHYRQANPAGTGEGPDHKNWFFLGSGLALWSTWQLSTAGGLLLGAIIPAGWSLDFTIALTFIALVVPALDNRPSLAAALSAGLVALLARDMPLKLGLVTAALVGVVVGLWIEARR